MGEITWMRTVVRLEIRFASELGAYSVLTGLFFSLPPLFRIPYLSRLLFRIVKVEISFVLYGCEKLYLSR
jgi:hypothetical protein